MVERSNKPVVRLVLKGRKSYEKWTLQQWIIEVKDIIEEEYGVEIVIEDKITDDDEPVLEINGVPVLIGLPGEEGYLIEQLKLVLDELLLRGISEL